MKGNFQFEYYLNEAEKILGQVKPEDASPGFSLYKMNLRTPFFMLESLSRVFEYVYDKKIFDKLKKQTKAVEDALGNVDFFDGSLQIFNKIPEINEQVSENLKKELENARIHLDKLLIEENWLNGKRIHKFRKNLKNFKWLKEKAQTKKIGKFYHEEISDTIKFIKENPVFHDMENQVHELRRKLRWLSIYATATRGIFQLKETNERPSFLEKYLTPDIVNSPYNQFPVNPDLKYVIELDKNRFYALSWIIQELGRIKDTGLLNESIIRFGETEHAQQTHHGINQHLLEQAHEITQRFAVEENLQQLVIGIKKIQ
jgi:hypothetical protein